jgi:hypothetical protein
MRDSSMWDVTKTRFGQLVVGEKFKLPGSDVLMIKESLRQDAGAGWVNATYDIINQKRPCYVNNDTQVLRKRNNQRTELQQSG